ncbi:hypothetical protein MJ575_07165 [Klebsiella pneumoniae]|nr:hypothetical protein MJ575_07165 [Klebsiella pneumoniae]
MICHHRAGETGESPWDEVAADSSLQRFLDRSRQAVQAEAWGKLDYPQPKTAIQDYTRDTIARFKQAGVLPIWCRSATKSTAASCGRKGSSRGGGEFGPAGWPAERGYRWPGRRTCAVASR